MTKRRKEVGSISFLRKNIAKHLLLNRVKSGLTQTDCADMLGVSFQQYQKWEKGSNRIYAEQLLELCIRGRWTLETFSSKPEDILFEYEEALHETKYSGETLLSERINFLKRKFQVLDGLMTSNTLEERE
jgi:transcriptional regulator with XRE-family HTH domain